VLVMKTWLMPRRRRGWPAGELLVVVDILPCHGAEDGRDMCDDSGATYDMQTCDGGSRSESFIGSGSQQ
jgi:hypothetical protein